MNRTTTAILFVLVLVLGGLVWWQTEREQRGDFDYVERLFEGVDVSRVRSMHIENIERGIQLTLERDAHQQWSLTDPIAYAARPSVVDALLGMVKGNTAILVPPDDRDFAEQGFDPPRMVFDVVEALTEDERRTTRVELGAFDLDGNRVYVRVRGKLFRTLRNLDTTLQQNVDGYRDPRIFDMSADEVVRVSRRGNFEAGPGVTPSYLQAHRQQFRWWIDRPVRGQADPTIFQLLLISLTSQRVDRFVDDAPLALISYGLQTPALEIELETRDGLTQTLLIGAGEGGPYAKRADLPYVWGLRRADLGRLMVPADDLLDHNMVRVLRAEVQRVEIENGRERVVLEREFSPTIEQRGSRREGWTVRAEPLDGSGAEASGTPGVRANRERVEQILSELEHIQIIRYLEDEATEDYFTGSERLGVWLQLREERQGGRIGKAFVTEGGAEARTYLRDNESEISLVPAEIAELLSGTSVLELQSLALFEIDEVHLRRLVLRSGDEERRYFRSIEGVWRYQDLDTAATELFSVLDALFFLRASEHLGVSAQDALAEPVEVEIMNYEGHWTRFIVAAGGERGAVVEIGGQRSILKDVGLHGRLLALFESR